MLGIVRLEELLAPVISDNTSVCLIRWEDFILTYYTLT
jgi:hypothetical protein